MPNMRRISLVAAICLGSFMASLDISIVNVALPTMQESLQTDMQGLQWVVDTYALCLSALILSSGPLGDRFGHKRIWLYGVALFTVGSIVCASASSLDVLLTGRIIQGIAGAAVIPGALSLLTHAFPEEKLRVRAIGIWSSVNALSLVIGPVLGGVLVHITGWQSIFWINIPVGLIALVSGVWGGKENVHPEHAALDPLGQGLSILWLGALTYGLIATGKFGWYSTQSLFPLYAALAIFILFIWVETRVSRPLLKLNLFRKTDFTGYNLASFTLGFSSYSSVFFVSLFLQQAQGWNPASTGWRMAPEFFSMAIASSFFGLLSVRLSIHSLMIVGYGLMGIALLLLTQLQSDSAYALVALYLVLLGAGMGVAMPATSTLVIRTVEPHSSGMASATMNALRQTGMTLGIALLGSLMSTTAVNNLTTSLQKQGVENAAGLARTVITEHYQIVDDSLNSIHLQTLTQNAFADGFGHAMFWAGLVCIAMTVWLLSMLCPCFRLHMKAGSKSSEKLNEEI